MSELNLLSSKILKSLSHPTRIEILKLLKNKPDLCVCKIYENLKLEQSNISQHLSILKNAGLVSSKKNGSWVNYKIEYPEIYKIIEISEKIVIAEYEKKYSKLKLK